MEIRKAQHKAAKIKLALQDPSGSGKTMSALLLASGIADWYTGKLRVPLGSIIYSSPHDVPPLQEKEIYIFVKRGVISHHEVKLNKIPDVEDNNELLF